VQDGGFRVTDAAMDPQGRYVVTVDSLGAAAVTSIAPGKSWPQLDVDSTSLGYADFVAVAVSPTGRLIATADSSDDHDLHLWDASTGTETFTLSGHSDESVALRFGTSDDELVSISKDGTALVWDLASRTSIHTLEVAERAAGLAGVPGAVSGKGSTVGSGEGTGPTAVDWSIAAPQPNRRIAIAIGSDVQLWNPETGRLERTLRGHLDRVASVAFDATGRRLVSASDDNTAVVWDTTDGHIIRRIAHKGWISGARFLPGGDRVMVVGGSYASPNVAWLNTDALMRDARARTTRALAPEECEQFQQLAGQDWHCATP
jgi:WD40 repeat protein